MNNKLPYTKEKPKGIVTYHHNYGDCHKYSIKIYNDHVIMSREGFQDLLFASREYYLLDDIYKTAGKVQNGVVLPHMGLYPDRKLGEY